MAHVIAQKLGKQLIRPEVVRFADGEVGIEFSKDMDFSGKKVFLVQSTYPPVNDHLMQVLFTIHALKNAGATEVVGLIPYFGYARHDKSYIKGKSGEVAVVIKMLEAAGLDSVIAVELHSALEESFFTIPLKNINLTDFLAERLISRS